MVPIIASRVLAVAWGRDPGFDQSMLLSNFPLQAYAQYFLPLPFFEQTAPLGAVAFLDHLSAAFGSEGHARITAVRSVAALAACLAYFMLYRALRPSFGAAIAALATILVASGTVALMSTTNAKHYGYEFLASVVMITVALRHLERLDIRSGMAYLVAALFTAIFAFTAPLLLVTVGAALICAVFARQVGPMHARIMAPDMVRTVVLTGLSVALALAFYLLYTRTVTALDFAAYSASDATAFIHLETPFLSKNKETLFYLLDIFYKLAEPTFVHPIIWRLGLYDYRLLLSLSFLSISLLGLVIAWRRSVFFGAGATFGLSGILILNVAGALPFTAVRHFMFLSPFTVPCFALGLVAMISAFLGLFRREAWTFGMLALLVATCGLALCLQATKLKTHEVSEYLDRTEQIDAPIWLYYGAQPSIRALRPSLLKERAPRLIGLIDHRSSPSGWLAAARADETAHTSEAYLRRARADLSGTEPIWLLFTHTLAEQHVTDGRIRFIEMAIAPGRKCWWAEGNGGLLVFCALPEDIPRSKLEALSMEVVPVG